MEHARVAAVSGKASSDPGSAWFGAGERSASAGLGHNARLIATAVAAFASVLGLALFLHLYICHVRRRNRRRREAAVLPTTAAAPPKCGLDASAIAALPTAAYGKELPGGGSSTTTECTICLGAVEEGDTVRVLPACTHVFHVPCVDTWLTSSSSCPVCRAGVEPPPPPPGSAACAQEKPQQVEKEEAGSSVPVRAIGASLLMKMLSRERPLVRRPQVADAGELDLDLERQQPQSQQQEQAVNN